jgi:CheY-like chemotaxis protein
MAKVLIIDDNRAFLELNAAFLSLDGHTVLTSDDPQQTLELVRQERPDIVLLDIVMPGVNGYQICRQIKEGPSTRDVLVVMMTALPASSRARSREAGADAYIAKPIPSRELREVVRQLAGREPPQKEP